MNPCTSRTTRTRRTTLVTVGLTALSLLSLSACGALGDTDGSSDSASPSERNDITVGLLLPDKDAARYEKFDRPLIEERVGVLTGKEGRVVYANAGGSTAEQSRQFGRMIADEVDVILVNAVDSEAVGSDVKKAKAAGIPVIAYDRLAEGPIDAYVSHDNELVGEVQGRAIVDELGGEGEKGKVVVMNGAPGDPNAALFKKGAFNELNGNVDMVKTYDTEKWRPEVAKANMEKAIDAVGADNVDAVYSANDSMAGAVIEALEEAGVSDLPPVTGQDADLEAVQRIVGGTQHMTVYKSFLLAAGGAAEIAVARVQGRDIQFDSLTGDRVDSATRKDIPTMLIPVVALTRDNIKDTVIRDDVYDVKDICTAEYRAACASIGLTP
ncbi:substrate-binding domain-containing protein [Streptomyces sp. M2CJ-2]|uniref:sugar ABC transporter substrate-binding protein n=1 Tax=Streptomyces sp. M2CJ-2 TaxID=2803948 RepID=UPI0027DBB236|nr:substrate-binding domain-containing protein [Streptomyces sp. M2CJ-2]